MSPRLLGWASDATETAAGLDRPKACNSSQVHREVRLRRPSRLSVRTPEDPGAPPKFLSFARTVRAKLRYRSSTDCHRKVMSPFCSVFSVVNVKCLARSSNVLSLPRTE